MCPKIKISYNFLLVIMANELCKFVYFNELVVVTNEHWKFVYFNE